MINVRSSPLPNEPLASLTLSDEEFASWYHSKMQEYENQGWWANAVPNCTSCHQEISGPALLRRFAGMSLHPQCFKTVWEIERKEYQQNHPLFFKYFERIVGLALSSLI